MSQIRHGNEAYVTFSHILIEERPVSNTMPYKDTRQTRQSHAAFCKMRVGNGIIWHVFPYMWFVNQYRLSTGQVVQLVTQNKKKHGAICSHASRVQQDTDNKTTSTQCYVTKITLILKYFKENVFGFVDELICCDFSFGNPFFVILSKHITTFPRYCTFRWGIHRSWVNYPHKGHWRGALVFLFSLILRLSKRFSTQLWGWWFETISRSLWCHGNVPFYVVGYIRSRSTWH